MCKYEHIAYRLGLLESSKAVNKGAKISSYTKMQERRMQNGQTGSKGNAKCIQHTRSFHSTLLDQYFTERAALGGLIYFRIPKIWFNLVGLPHCS